MAIYKIASLNYITAGNNRAFVNIDTILDYELCKPNYLLRNEEPYISQNVVSAYLDYSNVESNWSDLSNILSSFNNLTYIESNWANISNKVSSIILDDMKKNMTSSPLSVLCSDILTEQKDGNWLKTEYLTKEFITGQADNYALAAELSSPNIILNELQKYYNELVDTSRQYIKLYPKGTDEKTISKIEEFNKHRRHINRIFVLDTNLASRRLAEGYDGIDSSLNNMTTTDNNLIYPMYDIIDVHIKCAYKTNNSNLKKFDANVTGKREDIYLPLLNLDPLGLCQILNNAFILTEATDINAGILKSSLHKTRFYKDTNRTYSVSIEHDTIKTYLYKKNDNVIDIQNQPQSNIAGIEYNNIVEFPQNDIKVGYSEGNEYGYIIKGKNVLDSQYNMNLEVDNKNLLSVYNCRNYIGINLFAGNSLYYKFYDNISYKGISSDSIVSVTKINNEDLFPIVPYQKIETAYINQYSSTNLHKSRFFSIKIMNTELGLYENIPDNLLGTDTIEFLLKKIYSQIMLDIRNAVKEIVENLLPAHTQLYKVMFN